ncbi:hypothetical protein ACIBQ0_03675 [Nocardia nova]|uniref:hypothetical protein n=1 Tax=Nocardia nova TaxID=37330 RepID=UPI00378B3D4E
MGALGFLSFALPRNIFHVCPILRDRVSGARIVNLYAALSGGWCEFGVDRVGFESAHQIDVSGGPAIAVSALIAVLPEYAVDLYYAWTAGHDPPTSSTPNTSTPNSPAHPARTDAALNASTTCNVCIRGYVEHIADEGR